MVSPMGGESSFNLSGPFKIQRRRFYKEKNKLCPHLYRCSAEYQPPQVTVPYTQDPRVCYPTWPRAPAAAAWRRRTLRPDRPGGRAWRDPKEKGEVREK